MSTTNQTSLTNYFSPCPLCGHFLAVLTSTIDAPDFIAAVADVDTNWLAVDWDHTVRDVLLSLYGWNMGEEVLEHSSRCPICMRRFLFTRSEEGATLEIECKP
ncbi:MAG: hypothetical protein ABFQ89_01280 [Chloroflexota bacterium]